MQPGLCENMKHGLKKHEASLSVEKELVDNSKGPVGVQQKVNMRGHLAPQAGAALAAGRVEGHPTSQAPASLAARGVEGQSSHGHSSG